MKVINAGIKMAKHAAKWRESASLIVLSHFNSMTKTDPGYKVLLLSRPEQASFMPSSSVFPGGVRETADESLLWAKYFKNFGVKEEELSKLVLKRNLEIKPQPNIFKTEDECKGLHRDISLRITAIRETFEEIGIMLCRDRKTLNKSNNFAYYREDFDRKHWQHLVHQNPKEFLNLCQELDVVPDLWSLNEWSVWLTPAILTRRFETAFYLTALEKAPNVILEENESSDYKWLSPKEALLLNFKGDICLPPPQLYELSRLLNFNDLVELQRFAAERASRGTILMLPVQRNCSDGMVSIYPGDSNYPDDPNSVTELKDTEISMKEFRSSAKKLHRYEFITLTDAELHQNFEPIDGHKKPLSIKPLSNL